METYRTTVKRQIKDWIQHVTQKKVQDWLIIHVVLINPRMADKNLFSMKKSVLERLKADFNTDKRDRS